MKSKEEIGILKQYQREGWFDPYTCCSYNGCVRSVSNNWGELVPTENRWICPCGKYTQEYDGSENSAIDITRIHNNEKDQ